MATVLILAPTFDGPTNETRSWALEIANPAEAAGNTVILTDEDVNRPTAEQKLASNPDVVLFYGHGLPDCWPADRVVCSAYCLVDASNDDQLRAPTVIAVACDTQRLAERVTDRRPGSYFGYEADFQYVPGREPVFREAANATARAILVDGIDAGDPAWTYTNEVYERLIGEYQGRLVRGEDPLAQLVVSCLEEDMYAFCLWEGVAGQAATLHRTVRTQA